MAGGSILDRAALEASDLVACLANVKEVNILTLFMARVEAAFMAS